MRIGLEQIRALRLAERKKIRKRRMLALLLMVALAIVYLCLRERGLPLHTPAFVGKSLLAFVRYKIALWTGAADSVAFSSSNAAVVVRLENMLLMLLAGAVIALSGTVYQTAMRNPMAVPTMLGVSSGVNMAQIIMVLLYAEEVYSMTTQRYVLSYGISIGVLAVIMAVGKLVGGKRFSVADLLIVGTIVNRLFQTIITYLQSNMDDETLLLYQEYAQENQDYFSSFSDLRILFLVSAIVMLPLILMRFSFNMVSFEDEDARSLGLRSSFMRFYGIFAGGVLTVTAMIHAGNIGMLATVIPLLCRYIYGADFRNLLWGSAVWGGIILMCSNLVRNYTYIGDYQIPLGNIVSLMAIPLLIWIIRKQKTAWSEVEQ